MMERKRVQIAVFLIAVTFLSTIALELNHSLLAIPALGAGWIQTIYLYFKTEHFSYVVENGDT